MTSQTGELSATTELLHGIGVSDPYRWLENRSSPLTQEWIVRKQLQFEEYLLQLESLPLLEQRIRSAVDIETVDQLGKVRDRYFYRRRGIGEQQPSLFVTQSFERETCLVDSTKESPYTAVGIHRISRDGSLLAYEIKEGGEHSKAIRIVDVDTGTVLPDHLSRGNARGFVFRDTNDGFYYCHEFAEDSAALRQAHIVAFHLLGTSIEDDRVVLTLPRTPSSKLVLIYEGEMIGAVYCHDRSDTAVIDLYLSSQDRDETWRPVCQNIPAPFSPFLYQGRLFAHRFHDKPDGEIIELDKDTGNLCGVVVPEWNARIEQCAILQNRLYVRYLVETESVVRIWSLGGVFIGTLPLEQGYTWGLLPAYSSEVDELFLHCESFTEAPMLFRYLPQIDKRVVWSRCDCLLSANSVLQRRLSYPSKDGTEIFISLIGLTKDSLFQNRPTIMTAYGGFGISMTPQFSVFVSILLELGFLFALPEIRGGGERGRSWHEAARGQKRQVAFDDFIASAEWLCEKGFSDPLKLAAFGGSNAGTLVGAVITQRPELFRAVLCIAPLLDMIRYHLFDRARLWASEYGTAEDPEDFRALLDYSPYHNVREDVNYPSVLFVCGDKDTRCNPAHARKMAARLADRSVQRHPILVDYNAERGHSPTLPLAVRVEGLTHRIAFLCHELGVPIEKEVES
jgi:prolyl oligopeptidase